LADADPLAHLKSYIHGHVCAEKGLKDEKKKKTNNVRRIFGRYTFLFFIFGRIFSVEVGASVLGADDIFVYIMHTTIGGSSYFLFVGN
jgi:hypothetical protein